MIQQRTSRPALFELTEPTRDAITTWMHVPIARYGDWLFSRRSNTFAWVPVKAIVAPRAELPDLSFSVKHGTFILSN